MDRQALIDYIFAKGHDSRAVLEGLETEHLGRIKVWYESKAARDNMLAHYAGAVLAEQRAVARIFEDD